jgi:hypothetical protein
MTETSSPLGRHADTVAAIVTVAVTLTFVGIHGIAPLLGVPVPADTTQIDFVFSAVLGYVFAGVAKGTRSEPAPAPRPPSPYGLEP